MNRPEHPWSRDARNSSNTAYLPTLEVEYADDLIERCKRGDLIHMDAEPRCPQYDPKDLQ